MFFFCGTSRDAIAKILYALLFSWLTDRINTLVYPKNEALSISILDIYGFEVIPGAGYTNNWVYLQVFFPQLIFYCM